MVTVGIIGILVLTATIIVLVIVIILPIIVRLMIPKIRTIPEFPYFWVMKVMNAGFISSTPKTL